MTPPPPTVALLAFTPTSEAGTTSVPLYPGLPPPPPPPRRLAALARVGAGNGGAAAAAAATPAALWTARAARAAGAASSPVLLLTRAGEDEEAVRQWVKLSSVGQAQPSVVAVSGGGGGGITSLVGRAARAAAAAAPAGAPLLLIEADAVPLPWGADLARLAAAGAVLGCVALPVAVSQPPPALAGAHALAAGGGWWEGVEAEGAVACPPLGEPADAASPSARLSLPILYLPASAVEAFAAAADGVGAATLGPAVAALRAGGSAATAALPLPAPLPSAATRPGRALAAALLAKAPADPGATIAEALDGSRPGAVAFAAALVAQAGGGGQGAAATPPPPLPSLPPPPPPPTTTTTTTTPPERYTPPPRASHPAYTTTNATYGARPPAPHEVAVPAPAIAARAAARAALPRLDPPPLEKERGMRLAGAGQFLAG